MRLEVTTANPVQSRAVGSAIAGLLRAGDVVLLVGSLGTGKTTLVKGLVAALGGHQPVTSPTFTLAHKYKSMPPVTHVDLWRLEHLQEVVDLALEEELEDGGVAVVEWGDAAEPLFGADALVVKLDWGPTDRERTVAIEARGATWSARSDALARAVTASLSSADSEPSPC